MSHMKTSVLGLALLHHFESCSLKAYRDVKGVWTIGWGNTYYENNKPVRRGDVITQDRADRLFAIILGRFESDVNLLLKRKVKQYEFDSLVSFAYNVGSDVDADAIAEGLGDSTLLKMVNNNAPCDAIMKEFKKWNKSGGKVYRGLTRRRTAEGHLYCTGELLIPA